MKIRTFKPSDLDQVLHLFYDTVHTINAADYSKEQRDAWAPRHLIVPGNGEPANPNKIEWLEKLIFHHTVIVENEDEIVGFGDLTECTIDHLYVHKNYQRKGVATLILQELEKIARTIDCKSLDTISSITAKPFFEKNGFTVIAQQEKKLRGMSFITYHMQKDLT